MNGTLYNMVGPDNLSRGTQDSQSLPESIREALGLFQLHTPCSLQDLVRRYRELLRVWHPHRYAGLTNSPKQYMEMYRKGEAMTKALHDAYHLLYPWLKSRESRAGTETGS